MTIQGTALCGQTEWPRAGWCPSVIQVKDGDKTLNYYLVQNDVSKNFHENVCKKEGKKVTATGSVQELAGKLEFTPIKITLIE
jgi:hypothetical protein